MKKLPLLLACLLLIGCASTIKLRSYNVAQGPENIRGFSVYTSLSEQDVVDAKIQGANALRLMLMLGDLHDLANYQTCPSSVIVPEKLERLQEILDWCKVHQLTLILDVHEIPGLVRWSQESPDLMVYTFGEKDFRLWDKDNGQPFRNNLIDAWRQLATAFKDEPENSVVYELLNEPEPKENDWNASETGVKAKLWDELQVQLVKEVRKWDQTHVIIGAPSYCWRVSSLNDWQVPDELTHLPKFWVAVHFYHPHSFTHQFSPPYKKYPGEFDETLDLARDRGNFYWDKKVLKEVSKPITEFQDRYGLPVVVTEFSTLKWTPGADQWLKDVTDIFKSYHVGWIYHAWRERLHNGWDGWDLETGEPNRLKTISKAMK